MLGPTGIRSPLVIQQGCPSARLPCGIIILFPAMLPRNSSQSRNVINCCNYLSTQQEPFFSLLRIQLRLSPVSTPLSASFTARIHNVVAAEQRRREFFAHATTLRFATAALTGTRALKLLLSTTACSTVALQRLYSQHPRRRAGKEWR